MSSFSLDQTVSISDSVLSSSMVDESILLDLSREKYFSLDDVGTQMWKVLIESDSIQAAIDTLFEQYDAPYQLLKN